MPLSFFSFFLFFCQLNIPQPSCSPSFPKHLHRPSSCPHFIFGFTTFCTTTLYIYLNDFSVLKNNKLKKKSHLRFLVNAESLPFLWRPCMGHVTVKWTTTQDPLVLSTGACLISCLDTDLSENALLLTDSHFLPSSLSSHSLAAAFTPAPLTPCPYLGVLHFVTASALLQALAIRATPASRSHQAPPPSNLEVTSGSVPGSCGFSLVLPIIVWPWLGALLAPCRVRGHLERGITGCVLEEGKQPVGFCCAGPGSPAHLSLVHGTDWSCLVALW